MTRCLILALALLSPSLAQARDISGQMAYPQRIALPDGAALKIELRGPEGIVAEATIETGGRQVPLPFVIVAPDAQAYTLQGAVFVGGRAEWLSAPVPVAAGEGAVDLGVVPLEQHLALGFSTRLRCGDTLADLDFVGDDAGLRVAGEIFALKLVASASGARFSDGAVPETTVLAKGNTAIVTLKGQDLPECRPLIAPALLPLTARGNEPFWRLDLSGSGFVYQGNIGADPVEGPLPQPRPTFDGVRFDVSADFGFTIARALCRDTMAGMPHPLTVTVTDKGQTLTGCGGAPVDLLAGGWRVDHVEGAVLPEGSEVTIAFDAAESRVFGKSACNRYNAGFTLTGEGLSFGPAAGTMMACEQDLAAVEQVFLKGLSGVDRFDFAPDGALELFSGGKAVIRARR